MCVKQQLRNSFASQYHSFHNSTLRGGKSMLSAKEKHMGALKFSLWMEQKGEKKAEWGRNLNLNASLDWKHQDGIQALRRAEPVPAKSSEGLLQ